MSSSSCCGGSCGCGSACKCQTSCGGCKINPVISNSETTITAIAPNKSCHEKGAVTSLQQHDGCKCGASCTCNPCTCK